MNNLGSKIYELRKQNNMTLEEVGEIVGVGKSTVRKWETGEIANMRRDKIAKLAEALHTTPAYLMGWNEGEEKSVPVSEDALSNDEKLLIDLFRQIPSESRPLVLSMIKAALKNL
ncbi:MAG: helix-turn-helix transcriptional regulator [Oscillospiraceae bacterium]|jgi:transcriptional regulator with XRE-family HTH domain|nr:helix-turn-helix transcriptional regulator [Oscillospiraceae bacterium]MBQ5898126.1 helix-turn-helix transcriptional regulator [Oscillospiraceae bacterium]